jgi:hypothetical protein
MLSARYFAALALVSLVVVGCDDDDNDILGPNNSAVVQFVNASSAGTLTTSSNGTTLGTAVGSQAGSTSCTFVSPGSRTLTFSQNGSTTSTLNTNFVAGQRYTVVLQGTGANTSSYVIPENYTTQTAGNYGLRVINATGSAGDVYVTSATGALGTTPTASLASGAATGGTTGTNGFMSTSTANTRLRFFGSGSTTGALTDFTITNPSLTNGNTVVLANTATGGVTAFQLGQCS